MNINKQTDERFDEQISFTESLSLEELTKVLENVISTMLEQESISFTL